MDEEVIPFPNPEITPPVTKMNFICATGLGDSFEVIYGFVWDTRWMTQSLHGDGLGLEMPVSEGKVIIAIDPFKLELSNRIHPWLEVGAIGVQWGFFRTLITETNRC